MKNNKHRILFALLFPIICLLALTVYKHIKINTGRTIIIPITGYDPRDLLSGHYLTYRLDIKSENACTGDGSRDETVYLCLDKKDDGSVEGIRMYSLDDAVSSGCGIVIRGECNYRTFLAGIERFYIPEEHSVYLDKIVRRGTCSLLVKVDAKGKASIKDMLIDGKPWREYLKENPAD